MSSPKQIVGDLSKATESSKIPKYNPQNRSTETFSPRSNVQTRTSRSVGDTYIQEHKILQIQLGTISTNPRVDSSRDRCLTNNTRPRLTFHIVDIGKRRAIHPLGSAKHATTASFQVCHRIDALGAMNRGLGLTRRRGKPV
jgi:hypothetical protein